MKTLPSLRTYDIGVTSGTSPSITPKWPNRGSLQQLESLPVE